MWQLAWWWILLLAPLPWFVRRFTTPDYMDKDAALRVPVGAEFDDLLGAASSRGVDRPRLLLLWLIWLLVLLAAARKSRTFSLTVVGLIG
jgi:Ca-activated chloride channel family protein